MVELKGLTQSATKHRSLINKMVRKDKEHSYLSHKAKYCQKQKWYLGWYYGPYNPNAGEAEAATLQDQNHPGVHAETLLSPKTK